MTCLFSRALLTAALASSSWLFTSLTTAAAAHASTSGPQPAAPFADTGCSGSTCQTIDHSGNMVSDWYTETTASSSTCTHARYYENGVLIAESGTSCLSSGQQAAANWSSPGTFPSGTELCTSWYGISGEPCTRV